MPDEQTPRDKNIPQPQPGMHQERTMSTPTGGAPGYRLRYVKELPPQGQLYDMVWSELDNSICVYTPNGWVCNTAPAPLIQIPFKSPIGPNSDHLCQGLMEEDWGGGLLGYVPPVISLGALEFHWKGEIPYASDPSDTVAVFEVNSVGQWLEIFLIPFPAVGQSTTFTYGVDINDVLSTFFYVIPRTYRIRIKSLSNPVPYHATLWMVTPLWATLSFVNIP